MIVALFPAQWSGELGHNRWHRLRPVPGDSNSQRDGDVRSLKITVFGGAGYLGSILVPILLRLKHHVRVIDSLMYGVDGLLPVIGDPTLQVELGDIRDINVARNAIRDADVVINLAAIVGQQACNRLAYDASSVNTAAVQQLAGIIANDQLLIHASTGSIYGLITEVCDEDSPISPLTLYSQTKAAAEPAVLDAGGTSLRFATLFGASPRMRLDLLVNDLVSQAIRTGSIVLYQPAAVRTVLHVRDAAQAVILAIENSNSLNGQVLNVGDSRLNHTKMELCEAIRNHFEFGLFVDDVRRDPDQRDYYVSYQRIRRFGFEATISLVEGIRELAKVVPLVREPSAYRNDPR